MIKITIGSTIIGKSGKSLVVDRVEGDIIYSGEFRINISAVVRVEPLPIIDRLLSIASLGKGDAIDELTSLLSDFSVNSIYEASLDLETFFGTFIRRSLSELSPVEFETIGKDGSEGKYGVLTLMMESLPLVIVSPIPTFTTVTGLMWGRSS